MRQTRRPAPDDRRCNGDPIMRKLITTHWITLDGYIAGPDGEMDWLLGDEEMSDYEIGLVSDADTLMLGRQTYLDFAGYWPATARNPDAAPWERTYAGKVDALKKVVVSRTLKQAVWKEAEIWPELSPAPIDDLKAGGDKSIVMYGSADVVQQLANMGRVDEYHLLVHPVILGAGRLLLENIEHRIPLERAGAKPFKSGVMLMVYRPMA
jgi:dihydrofolate reductase